MTSGETLIKQIINLSYIVSHLTIKKIKAIVRLRKRLIYHLLSRLRNQGIN